MKTRLLIYFCLSFLHIAHAGLPLPDTVLAELDNKHGYERIQAMNALSENYLADYPDLALQLAQKAEQLSRTEGNEATLANAVLNASEAFYYKCLFDTAKALSYRALALFQGLNDSIGISGAYKTLGNIAHKKGIHDTARHYYHKSLKFVRKTGKVKPEIVLYSKLGASWETGGDFLKALKYFTKARHLADSVKAPREKALAMANLTHTYQKLGDYEKAISSGFQVLNLTREHNLSEKRTFAYEALGSAYKAINNYSKAMEAYARGLNLAKAQKNKEAQAKAYNNIGDVLLRQGEHPKAANYFKKSLNLYKKLNNSKGKSISYNYLANAYLNLGLINRGLLFVNRAIDINNELHNNYNLAENYLVKGRLLMQKGKMPHARELLLRSLQLKESLLLLNKKEVLHALAEVHQQMGNLKKANQYFHEYITNEEMVRKARKSKRIERLKIENELKEHIHEKHKLKEQARLKEQELENQQMLRNAMIVGIVLLIAFIVTILSYFRHRMKSYRELKARNQQIEQQSLKLAQTDEELRKFRFILNNAGNAVIITSPDGKIQWINKAMTRVYGFSISELKNLEGSDMRYKSGCKGFESILDEVNKTGKTKNYESVNYTHQGHPIYAHTTLTPIKNANGEITNLVFIDSDITHQKEIEEELKKTIQTRDKFLSIIAHDLRNPFNAIIGFARLMLAKFDTMDRKKQVNYLKNIQLAANQGYELLFNLLHWARSQSGNIHYAPEKFKLKEVVVGNIKTLKFRAEEKQIEINNQVGPETEVWADYNMTDTIIRNLFSNAIKFTSNNGSVNLKSQSAGDYVQVDVEDTGLGMNRETVDRIFRDINFTTKGTSNESGTGLGLVLCKEFVEKNKGAIWVTSKPGKGSTFSFTLPLAD